MRCSLLIAAAMAVLSTGAAETDGAWPESVARANAGKMRYERWLNNYHESFVYKIFLKQKGEPHARTSLDEALEIIKRTSEFSGGLHQIVYLVGWNYDGHDSCYPSWDKVGGQCRASWSDDPTLALRRLITMARDYNADVSLHICANDAYANSPLWQTYIEKDLLCRNADGSLVKGQVFGGEQSYPVCHAKEWNAGYLQKRILALLELIPELRDTHTIHIDALFGVESKYEGITIAQDVEAICRMVDFWREQGLDVTTEFLPAVDQIGNFPFIYHLNLDERLKTLCPASVICGGVGYNTRTTQNFYNKDWRGMMPLPGCVYEEAWGVAHPGDLTRTALEDLRRHAERVMTMPALYAYLNRSRVVRHVEDTKLYAVERENGVWSGIRMKDRALRVKDNGRVVVSDGDQFLDFPQNGGVILAWSAKGCVKTFALPPAFAKARALKGSLVPDGTEVEFPANGGVVGLTLPARTGAVLKPLF